MPFRFRPLGLLGSILEVLGGALVLSWTTEGYSIGFTVMLVVAGIALIGVGVYGVLVAARRAPASRQSPGRDINSA